MVCAGLKGKFAHEKTEVAASSNKIAKENTNQLPPSDESQLLKPKSGYTLLVCDIKQGAVWRHRRSDVGEPTKRKQRMRIAERLHRESLLLTRLAVQRAAPHLQDWHQTSSSIWRICDRHH